MSDLKRFFKHSSIYAIGNIINRLGAFLLLPVYTNYLSVAEYGTLELFYVTMSIVSGFLAVGMAHATLRFYFDHDEQKDRNASISTNYIGSFFITLFGVLLISIFTNDISKIVFEDDTLTTGVYLILFTLVFELSAQICLAYIRAIEYSVFFVIISFAKLIIQVSLNTYLVIYQEAGVIGVLFGNLITVFFGWLVLTYFTISRCGFKFDLSKFIPVLKYCLPFLLATIMAIISNNADKYILSQLISFEALGLFALALKFSMIIEQLIGEPFSRSYGAFRYTIMDNENAAKIQSKIFRYLTIISVFSALFVSLYAKDIIYLISDKSYWQAADLVPIIMISSLLKIINYPVQTGILYAKQTKYLFYIRSYAAVISVSGNLLLINIIGLYGACLSLILVDAFILFLTHIYSQRYFYVKYDYWSLLLIIFIAICTFLPTLVIDFDSVLLNLLFKLILLGGFSFSVYKAKILKDEEITEIKLFLMQKFQKSPI
jgi:O-antigen/teichoic acid export membrane protein